MKKFLALLLALCMVLTLFAGCSSGEKENAANNGNEPNVVSNPPTDSKGDVEAERAETIREKLTLTCSSDFATFDPVANKLRNSTVNFCLFQFLGNVDSEGNLRLQLLKSYEKKDDVTYNFTLWDCIHDSEGNPFTAEDVQFCLQNYQDAGNSFERFESMEITGDYTFTWHLSGPYGLGELGEDLGLCPMYCKEAYEARGNDMTNDPVGTGSYKVADYVVGSSVTLEMVEDFWMNDIRDEAWLAENDYVDNYQNVKTIEVLIIQDASSRAVALEMGTVDAADTLNIADVNNFIAHPELGVSTVQLPVSAPISFYFNCNEASQCSDVNLRKAICYAIDNASFAAALGLPAYEVYGIRPNLYNSPESWLTGEGRDYYNFNMDKAQEYLAKSNYNGKELVILYSSGTAEDAATILLKSMLKKLGVETTLYCVEGSVMQQVQYDWTAWDIRIITLGGGDYLNSCLKRFNSMSNMKKLNGLLPIGIEEPTMDALFLDLDADTNDATIEAWDNYFTYEKCYGYSICGYYDLTAARNGIHVVLTSSKNRLVGGAFTYDD